MNGSFFLEKLVFVCVYFQIPWQHVPTKTKFEYPSYNTFHKHVCVREKQLTKAINKFIEQLDPALTIFENQSLSSKQLSLCVLTWQFTACHNTCASFCAVYHTVKFTPQKEVQLSQNATLLGTIRDKPKMKCACQDDVIRNNKTAFPQRWYGCYLVLAVTCVAYYVHQLIVLFYTSSPIGIKVCIHFTTPCLNEPLS